MIRLPSAALVRHAQLSWRRFAMALAMLCFAGTATAAVNIELAETAQVATPTIYLRDVAKLDALPTGMDSAALGDVKLGMFGARNAALKLSAKRVAHMIALQRPALAGLVHLSGASAVLVSLRSDSGGEARDLAPQVAGVRRGEHVRLIVRNGGIVLEQSVVALAGALPGQTVRVQSPASRTVHTVRVVGGGVVEMEL